MRGRKPQVQPTENGPVPQRIRPPKELTGRPIATAEWRRLAAALKARGTFTLTDPALLLLWARAWEIVHECDKEIEKHGVLMPAERGGLKSNPTLLVRRAYAESIVKMADALGLSPVGAARMGADGPQAEEDPLMDLLGQIRAESSQRRKDKNA